MIFTKELKEKRLLFIVLMVLEYLIITRFIQFSMYIQLLYTTFTYIILKILYKEKAQIIDIFTFTIASAILILTSAICFVISGQNVVLATIINRILIFTFIYIFRNKLNKIQKIYKNIWNRESNKTKIKSTTFRSINIIAFNIIFYLINAGMLFAIYYNSK